MANCDLVVSGASTVDLTGSAADVSIEASGASKIRLADLPVNNARVDISGASNATVNARGRLDGSLSGGSVLYYRGNPTLGTLEASGGSRIEKK